MFICAASMIEYELQYICYGCRCFCSDMGQIIYWCVVRDAIEVAYVHYKMPSCIRERERERV